MSEQRVIVRSAAQMRRRRALLVAATAAVLASGWGLYTLGKAQAPGDWRRAEAARQELEAERRALLEENGRLREENRRLSERIVQFRRSADIDRVAADELRQSIETLQSRVAELRKELAFYRGIVSPEEAQTGLQVQEFRVRPADQPGAYRFHLVLIQAVRHNRRISGQVRLRLQGRRNGELVNLEWPEIALDSPARLVFSFRYYQELDATFRVPPTVEPALIQVEIVPGTDRVDSVTELYRWPDLTGDSG